MGVLYFFGFMLRVRPPPGFSWILHRVSELVIGARETERAISPGFFCSSLSKEIVRKNTASEISLQEIHAIFLA